MFFPAQSQSNLLKNKFVGILLSLGGPIMMSMGALCIALGKWKNFVLIFQSLKYFPSQGACLPKSISSDPSLKSSRMSTPLSGNMSVKDLYCSRPLSPVEQATLAHDSRPSRHRGILKKSSVSSVNELKTGAIGKLENNQIKIELDS